MKDLKMEIVRFSSDDVIITSGTVGPDLLSMSHFKVTSGADANFYYSADRYMFDSETGKISACNPGFVSGTQFANGVTPTTGAWYYVGNDGQYYGLSGQ